MPWLANPSLLNFLPAMLQENAFPTPPQKRKKKVDLVALQSPLKRIPGMDLASVRDLIDIGVQHVDDLRGRSPEALLDEILNLREQTPPDRLHYIRMAVYYAETDNPDPQLLQPWKWADSSSLH
jgi:hypothetical protein